MNLSAVSCTHANDCITKGGCLPLTCASLSLRRQPGPIVTCGGNINFPHYAAPAAFTLCPEKIENGASVSFWIKQSNLATLLIRRKGSLRAIDMNLLALDIRSWLRHVIFCNVLTLGIMPIGIPPRISTKCIDFFRLRGFKNVLLCCVNKHSLEYWNWFASLKDKKSDKGTRLQSRTTGITELGCSIASKFTTCQFHSSLEWMCLCKVYAKLYQLRAHAGYLWISQDGINNQRTAFMKNYTRIFVVGLNR